MPAPYRVPVFAALASLTNADVHCIYLTHKEPNRDWQLEATSDSVHVHYPPSRELQVGDKFIHFTAGLSALLAEIAPDVVVTTSYSQPYLTAFLHAWRRNIPHVVMTDGTDTSEQSLTWMHRQIRRAVFARSAAFVGPSLGSRRLYASYGIASGSIFQSHLCADMAHFQAVDQAAEGTERPVDFIFSGRMHPVKNPGFAMDVAAGTAHRIGRRVSMVYLGKGPLWNDLQAQARAMSELVDVKFPGFLDQTALPRAYRQGKIFLFPSSWDPWGVVANEACAVGLPVLVTPMAGAAGEIVRDHENGRILPLDLRAWIDAATVLLSDEALWQRMSTRGRQLVADYTYDNAAHGLADAVTFALRRDLTSTQCRTAPDSPPPPPAAKSACR
ncbi:glycosyltransferase [Sphaerotilus sp.]|uniref:glycosyltransferase family 4 protein n=1 Tax=Sphaerotilus sp. TaxID=2093942 RepID=UPI00286E2F13|nr:glycosyltransferase [Sphaerotilus sp.]